MRNKLIALLVAFAVTIGILPILSEQAYAEKADSYERYTVLILDVSGSMTGTPMQKQKEAAKLFCESLFSSGNNNKVAIVGLESNAEVYNDFTNDLKELESTIDGLYAYGGTNMNAALETARNLMDSVYDANKTDIYNIVLCSDGLPQTGVNVAEGRYSSEDLDYYYMYGNAVYNTAQEIQKKYKVYSLGFFHNLDGEELSFGKKLMEDIQNSGFYIVTNPEELEFTFGEIAERIVSSNPIIIIPGIMGSRFYSSETEFNDSTRIWDPIVNFESLGTSIDTLSNLIDLNSLKKTVYVRPCENQQNYKDGGSSAEYKREYGARETYKKIIDQLCNEFPDRPVYFFSYDWRKSNEESAYKLNEVIKSITQNGSKKVDLLCHSMGGLVASKYFAEYGSENLGKVITCGTPYEGAPKLLNAVLNWDVVGRGISINKNNVSDFALATLGGLRKNVKRTFQGVVELAPTENYCKRIPMMKDSWKLANRGDYDLSYDDYTKICNSIFDESRFTAAHEFHKSIHLNGKDDGYNALLSYENAYFILGIDQPTITSVKFQFSNNDVDQLLEESDLTYSTKGDATVPYYSSSISEQVNNLNKDERYFEYKTDHDGTINSKKARETIMNLLGASEEAQKSEAHEKRAFTVIRIACPVEATITRDGEYLSSNLSKFSDIASFGRMDILGQDDDIKLFFVYSDELSKVEMHGTDTGTMDYSIRYYDEDEQLIKQYDFENVPVTKDSTITTETDEDKDSVLIVDSDNDGKADSTWTGIANKVVKKADSSDSNHYEKDLKGESSSEHVKTDNPKKEIEHTNLEDNNKDQGKEKSGETEKEIRLFADVPEGTWYCEAVKYCYDKGYMAGKSEKLFDPHGTVTRATITQVLYAMEGKPTVQRKAGFRDVKKGSWYEDSVNWAASIGIAVGYSPTEFRPDAPVTRQQMVAMLYKYAKYRKCDVSAIEDISSYSDAGSVSKYAILPIKWAVGHNIIKGTDKGLEPKGTATRAQIAVILQAYDENILTK